MARYWRITGIETYGGGDLELSELQLFALDANNNPVRVDQTATLTSSVPPIAGTLSALNDGDTSTTARFPTGPGLAFVWDFGDGGANVDVAYLAGAPGKGTGVKSLVLQYSSDGMSYATLGFAYDLNHQAQSGYVDVHTLGLALFLPFDGPHGSKTFINYGYENIALTPVGNPYISNTNFKFGNGSAYFSGDGDGIRCDDLAKYITNVPFTLDCWVYITTPLKIPAGNPAVHNLPIIGQTYSSSSGGVYIGFYNDLRITFDLRGGTPGYWYGGVGDPVPTNTWAHVLFSLSGEYLRGFINGVKVCEFSTSRLWNGQGYPCYIGMQYNNPYPEYKGYFNGYIDNLRIRPHYVQETDFDIGSAGYYLLDQNIIGTRKVGAYKPDSIMIRGADIPPFTTATASPPIAIDIIDGGTGRLTGTVREKTGISTRPLKRRVVLLDYRSNRKLRETVSDEKTGVYSFDEIDLNREYTVIALDHTGQYRAVIADKLVPEKML